MTYIDLERLLERVVHARGAGAHGYFKVYNDTAKKYTFAPVLTDSSLTTPVFIRFSTVQGSRGSAVSMLVGRLSEVLITICLGYCPRRSRFCRQILHARGQLGHRWQ